eukprot:4208405-Pyramimonas_sp.AAC.1
MRKLAIGMKHLQFVKKVWLNCKRRGAHMQLENPLTSRTWQLMPWLGSEFVSAMMHRCAEGSNLVDFMGDPVKKPT